MVVGGFGGVPACLGCVSGGRTVPDSPVADPCMGPVSQESKLPLLVAQGVPVPNIGSARGRIWSHSREVFESFAAARNTEEPVWTRPPRGCGRLDWAPPPRIDPPVTGVQTPTQARPGGGGGVKETSISWAIF